MTQIENKETVSPVTILLFTGAILLQIIGMALFPLTAGYTNFWPTIASVLSLLLGSLLSAVCFTKVSSSVYLYLWDLL